MPARDWPSDQNHVIRGDRSRPAGWRELAQRLRIRTIPAAVIDGELKAVGVHLFGTGFLLSLIYGLASHMLPRFTGNPIAMGAWPWMQFGALNGGLLLFLEAA